MDEGLEELREETISRLIKVMQDYEGGMVALTKGMEDILKRVEKMEKEIVALKLRGNLVVVTDHLKGN